MKKKVNFSTWSMIVTAGGLIVLLFILYHAQSKIGAYFVAVSLIVLCGLALFYMPMSISVGDGSLNINRSLRIKSIPLNSISSIELCAPTMTERRIFGSGGWFGYWGWNREPSVGKYFAYYGKASDCFLVTLKDGSRYLLGCEDPKEIVDLVNHDIASQE